MSIKEAIGISFLFVIISGFVVECLRMTMQFWDSGNWGKLALGIFATLAFFALLVGLVKVLFDSKGKKEEQLTEEERREIRSRPSRGKKTGKDIQ